MFRKSFKKSEEDEDNEYYTVVKLCFHCGRDGEYGEDETFCHFCGFPI